MANTDENIIIEDIQVLSSFNVHLEEDGRLTQTTQRWQIVKKKKKIQIFQGNKCKKSFQNAIKQFLKFTKDKNASNICFYNCKKNESWWKLSDIYHNIDESVLICTKKK